MPDVVIQNPVINSPFREPNRHFRFDDQGITNEVADGRRSSGYFIPIAQPKKRGKQLEFPTRRPSIEQIRDDEEGARLLAGYLLRQNADRIRSERQGDQSVVHFHFDH